MKFNMISYTLAFSVIATFFPYLVFAPWSIIKPPKPPEDDVQWTCTQWIEYHGFTLDDYNENRTLSNNRNVLFDKDASTWAAIYAFRIGGKRNTKELLPYKFCETFGTLNNGVYPYKSLKSEHRSCEEWILLYRFTDNTVHNIILAISHDAFTLGEIPIWTFSYIMKLAAWKGRYFIKPSDFCAQLGKKVGQDAITMPFMNVNETSLTCKAWIELYEFSDDLNSNYEKAKDLDARENSNGVQCPYFPRIYANYLQETELEEIEKCNMTPLQFCRIFVSAHDSSKYNFLYGSDEVMVI